jgi:radical SAM-linked protein
MSDPLATTDSSESLTEDEVRQRVRLTYAKGEAIKFISHQDEFRLWERTLRRADLPLLYKRGFNPQPHIQFASPLGVGFTGRAEPIDIVLSPPVPLDELLPRIRRALPPGVILHDGREIDLKTPALQASLIGADYTIILYADVTELSSTAVETAIAQFLAETVVWRERERKRERYTYNLRPLIHELSYLGYNAQEEEHRIFLRVQQRAGATGRPDEVVDALGFGDLARTLRRDQIYISDNAEDVQVFAAYPLIEQQTIAGPPPGPAKSRGLEPTRQPPTGRSISERAADEFD